MVLKRRSDVDDEIERLQIEGTVRDDIDEAKTLNSATSQNDVDFDNYWSTLNWGASERRSNPPKPKAIAKVDYPLSKQTQHYNRNSPREELIDSEVEFIDPSKVSRHLNNVRFMRIQQSGTPRFQSMRSSSW